MQLKQEKETKQLELIELKKKLKEQSYKNKEFMMLRVHAARYEKHEEVSKIKQENAQLLEELRQEE